MQQQLARPNGVMVCAIAVRVGTDVASDEPCLIVLDDRVSVRQIGPSFSARFHFGAGESESGFKRVLDQIVVPRLAVLRNEFACLASRDGR
jgi:hypothetical protein